MHLEEREVGHPLLEVALPELLVGNAGALSDADVGVDNILAFSADRRHNVGTAGLTGVTGAWKIITIIRIS